MPLTDDWIGRVAGMVQGGQVNTHSPAAQPGVADVKPQGQEAASGQPMSSAGKYAPLVGNYWPWSTGRSIA